MLIREMIGDVKDLSQNELEIDILLYMISV